MSDSDFCLHNVQLMIDKWLQYKASMKLLGKQINKLKQMFHCLINGMGLLQRWTCAFMLDVLAFNEQTNSAQKYLNLF